MSKQLGLILTALAVAAVSAPASAKGSLKRRAAAFVAAHGGRQPAKKGLCANFEGTWKGTCTIGGQEDAETLVVSQYDCGSISLSHDADYTDDITIGGTMRDGSTSFVDGNEDNFSADADWENGHQVLVFRAAGQFRDSRPASVLSLVSTQTYRIADGKLVSHAETSFTGVVAEQPTDAKQVEDCSYEKTR